jgi:hypothetical protein
MLAICSFVSAPYSAAGPLRANSTKSCDFILSIRLRSTFVQV